MPRVAIGKPHRRPTKKNAQALARILKVARTGLPIKFAAQAANVDPDTLDVSRESFNVSRSNTGGIRDLEWSGRRGSNSRHLPWQGSALPAELRPHSIDLSLQGCVRIFRNQAIFAIGRVAMECSIRSISIDIVPRLFFFGWSRFLLLRGIGFGRIVCHIRRWHFAQAGYCAVSFEPGSKIWVGDV